MPDKPSDQPPTRRSSRSRSPQPGPAPVRDRREHHQKRNNGGAQKGQQSLSKSDQQMVRRLLIVEQRTRGVGKSMSDLANIKPKFDEKGKLFPLISDEEVYHRSNKRPGKEPDFMERVSANPSASHFNWMAHQDRLQKPNAFLCKTTTDDESLAALVNRIKLLAEENNTPVANFRLELVPQFFVEKHRNEIEDIRASVQREQEPILMEDDQQASEVAEAPVVCGNKLCGRKGHTLAQCVIPDPKTGLVYGCPLCNAGDHLVDWNCPQKPQPAFGARHVDRAVIKEYIETLLDVLFVQRANRPSFATIEMTWPLVFHCYRWDAKAIKSYAELDGSVWDPKGCYPWTNEYAIRMADTEEKRARLWGFDPAKDDPFSCPHLSQDPTYLGYRSLSETIQAFLKGQWALATGHIPTEKTTHLLRPAYLEARASQRLTGSDFFVKQEEVKQEESVDPAVPPAPVNPGFLPSPTIVHNASNSVQYVWNERVAKFECAPTWEFLVATPDKAKNLLRRCDPQADYAIEYAAWVFKYQQIRDAPVGDTLEEQALRAVMQADARFRREAQEWENRRAELDRQAEERKSAREAEEREKALEAKNSTSTKDVEVKLEHD